MRVPEGLGGFDRRRFLSLAALGGSVLLVGGWASPHGLVASPAAQDALDLDGTVTGLAIAGDRAVAVGRGAAGEPAIWHRGTDLAWRRAATLAPEAVLGDVVAVPNGFVAVGSVAREPAAWRCTDGTTWGPAEVVGAGPGHLAAVAADGSQVLACGARHDGESGEGYEPLVVTGADASAWSAVSTGGLDGASEGSLTAVARQAGHWIVASTATGRSGLWSAADGTAWRPAAAPGADTVAWASLLPTAKGVLAVGTTVPDCRPTLARTSDSLTWLPVAVPQLVAEIGPALRTAAADVVSGTLSVLEEQLGGSTVTDLALT
ncbi:hypothetical protein BH20ACT2_BH20ACT2_22780 [soil metagenome]